ncbi:MAG TPA: TIGR03086 family metal-binding protein [Chloroflexota bacterium]|nr:TIGR03086 family metal-binding protein [Chloroflexota bacterium]
MATVVQEPPTAGEALGLAELHRRACESTRRIIAGIKPEQWQNTCNSAGDVLGLVNHLVRDQLVTVELLHGKGADEAGRGSERDLVGHDALAAYDAACALAQAAWEEPGALERVCRTDHGDRPAALWASIRVMDVFVHGWDLATATGQDARLDPELSSMVYADWQPREAMLRGSGMFAPSPEVPPDADIQTKMLALFGRAADPAGAIHARELGHVGMYVRDLEASVRFYRDLIGFGESGRLPGAVFLTTGRSHHELALIEPGPEAVAGPVQPAFGVNHIAVRIGDTLDDLRRAHRRLVRAGIPIQAVTDFTIQLSVQIKDPDGTMVELYIDTDAPWRDNPQIIAQALPKPLQL